MIRILPQFFDTQCCQDLTLGSSFLVDNNRPRVINQSFTWVHRHCPHITPLCNNPRNTNNIDERYAEVRKTFSIADKS